MLNNGVPQAIVAYSLGQELKQTKRVKGFDGYVMAIGLQVGGDTVVTGMGNGTVLTWKLGNLLGK